MTDKNKINYDKKLYENLKVDCENCFGFCCVALYFSASEGFPTDKDAGKPCINLQSDFKCAVHKKLRENGLKGCTAYECFGAGQKVAQVTYGGNDWRKNPETAKQMFDVFLVMRQLHEMLWYLTEALRIHHDDTIKSSSSMLHLTTLEGDLTPTKVTSKAGQLQPIEDGRFEDFQNVVKEEINCMINETEKLTNLDINSLLKIDLVVHRHKVNALLSKTSEFVRNEARKGKKTALNRKKIIAGRLNLIGSDIRKVNLIGEDFRGALLIAANLRGADLSGADLIGADLRDADIRGANLTNTIFITQAQINAAKGDADTRLPVSLVRPSYWEK